MSKKKLLEKLQQFFDSDQQDKIKHSQQIKKVLKKLKEKERKIQQNLELCKDPGKVAELQQELDIIYAQRMKG
ncbi:MAG: hypothetical protein H0A75_07565 [Candidatus Methanofishera endochildressiae]|uniref:Uncharacterized protein n=1 Tax=Candidatus Methanofishera endochildressiae TaxID=2738884 RepID=A0A7Z0SFI5_9GAMM|nr:hypothetical protein [Candidatus Methanofishera endochildressiae]